MRGWEPVHDATVTKPNPLAWTWTPHMAIKSFLLLPPDDRPASLSRWRMPGSRDTYLRAKGLPGLVQRVAAHGTGEQELGPERRRAPAALELKRLEWTRKGKRESGKEW